MGILLTTLGGLGVACGDRELDWLPGQRARAALFVYLAVERRASRATLATLFWPESDEARARQSLRQALHHLRKGFGCDWIDSHAHELRVHETIHADTTSFTAALERGDVEAASRLYGGAFLAGINLLDLKPWETWVDGRRALYAREFRKASRAWVDAKRAAGDMDGALEAARLWVAPDPLDDEAQHRLIQLLADAGERAEAIRQYETYVRLLDADGLRPLAETMALMERVRAVPAAPRPAAAVPVPPASPVAGAALPPATPPTPTSRTPRIGARPTGLPAALRPLLAAGVLLVLLGAAWLVEPRIFQPAGPMHESAPEEPAGAGIVLADFTGPESDPSLGAVVTNALRIDLLASGAARVLDPAQVRAVLQRMQAGAGDALEPALAREVALRHGAKAVLQGEVARIGSGWVLSASLHAAASGRVLASHRETARSPEELIPAIDRLSRAIRRSAGESLQGIAAAPGLAHVTTSSLDALRVYTEAERTFGRREYHRATALLEEALVIDPGFAMAWRLLAAALHNTQADRMRQLEAAQRAFDLRHRLPPRERHLAIAAYHLNVTRDWSAATEHYRRVLEIQPHDESALNNLALLLRRAGDFDGAAALLERSVSSSRGHAVLYLNLVGTRLAQGRVEDAALAADALVASGADPQTAAEAQFEVRLRRGDVEEARAVVEPLLDIVRPARERAWAHDRLARLALWRGAIEEARTHFDAAERIIADAGPGYNPFAWRVSRAYAEAVLGDAREGVRLLTGDSAEALAARSPAHERLHDYRALVFGFAGHTREALAALRRLEDGGAPELQQAVRMRTATSRALVALEDGDAAGAVRIIEEARAAEACRHCAAALMGRALRESGRPREALAEWEDALAGRDSFEDFGFVMVQQLWVLQRLPELCEELGDRRRALHHHQRLVLLWQHADPELQPVVQRSRDRLRALQSPLRLSGRRPAPAS